MIIVNGSIEFKQVLEAEATSAPARFPKKPSFEWSKPIPCQYISKEENLIAQVSGEHITRRYFEILIDAPFELKSEQLRLKGKQGEEVAELSVQRAEELEAVQQYRIIAKK